MAQTRDEKLELLMQILKTKIDRKLLLGDHYSEKRKPDDEYANNLKWIKNDDGNYELVLRSLPHLRYLDTLNFILFLPIFLHPYITVPIIDSYNHLICTKEISIENLNKIINSTPEQEREMAFEIIEKNYNKENIYIANDYISLLLKRDPNDIKTRHKSAMINSFIFEHNSQKHNRLATGLSDFIITIIGSNTCDQNATNLRKDAYTHFLKAITISIDDKFRKEVLEEIAKQLPNNHLFYIDIKKKIETALSLYQKNTMPENIDKCLNQIKTILGNHIKESEPRGEYTELTENEFKLYCKKNNSATFFPSSSLKGHDVEDQKGHVKDVKDARTNLDLHNAL